MGLSNHKVCFSQILNEVSLSNADRLMCKARMANRLAKTLKGKPRRQAYAVKHQTLLALRKGFPSHVYVNNDNRLPEFVIVNFQATRFSLHAPAFHFRKEEKRKCAA